MIEPDESPNVEQWRKERSYAEQFREGIYHYFRPRLPEVAFPWNALFACVLWLVLVHQIVARIVSILSDDKLPSNLLATAVRNPALFLGALTILWWLAPPFARSLGLGRDVLRAVFMGILHCLLWFPVVVSLNIIVSLLVPDRPEHPAIEALEDADTATVVVLWMMVVVGAPLWEELLFRGILQTGLYSLLRAGRPASATQGRRDYLSWISIFVTSILFAGVHASQWPDPIPLVILALGLGLSFAYTGSLWSSIAFHASFNAIMLGLATLEM